MHVEQEEEEQPMRLQPLASSTVPSIREILAADQTAEKEEARKARKEKKKKGKEGGRGGVIRALCRWPVGTRVVSDLYGRMRGK